MTLPMLDFLNRCLDEDEQTALLAAGKAPPPWQNSNGLVRHSGPPESGMERDNGLWDDEGTSGMKVDHRLCMWGEVADHVALHDPAAVLALVAAHRAILFYHSGSHECSGPDDNAMWICDEVCPTVRALVSALAHREGYLPEWSPT